ncbi:hypothetical protein U9M48_041555 [Paspalum notatum var. saurae]|uniref:Uncharacterized protein n=1 Tax=Paspalum notatum var. saurae TaxID=547442 RepID=A0AAQ3XDG3_PASNO
MGRLILVNSVLDSQLIYLMSAVRLDVGFIKQVDRTRRAFLWSGEKTTHGSQCLVAWEDVCGLKADGRLGVEEILDQVTFTEMQDVRSYTS